MSYKYCNHIKENGTRCRAAALRGRNYCYFHARIRARRLALAQTQARGKRWRLKLPPLEDMHAVQSSLMQVLDAIAAGAVEERQGTLLLYGLQQASSNIKASTAWIGPSRFAVNEDDDYRAQSYAGLETEFELPKRIDLDTEPELAFPQPVEAEWGTLLPDAAKKPPARANLPKLPAASELRDAG